jgi:hypothetical protein
MLINPKGKLLAVLDHADEYRVLAMRSRARGEREALHEPNGIRLAGRERPKPGPERADQLLGLSQVGYLIGG